MTEWTCTGSPNMEGLVSVSMTNLWSGQDERNESKEGKIHDSHC